MSVTKVDQDSFENEVLKSNVPVLVDFWAEWCGPCRALTPILDEVSSAVDEKAKVVKVNVDENEGLAQHYGVRGIPTLIFFKDGSPTSTLVGARSKDELIKGLEELI